MANIPAKEILFEYQGTIVRRVHADKLEDAYQQCGADHYLFSVDGTDYIIDATLRGSMTRFINHSCGPNCEVKTVTADGQRKIIVRALRDLQAGEELTYDYRLAYDPEFAIRCRCGSRRCRVWL
eukprot:TRINITY_DN16820_c0_g1_i1.p2 TRINITY_DN16820_c0_g1~~TRINITY_DN16820_c0_g1_i1.p2  ORF type:complete len:124 (-),score=5.08 TRINITY_DN16820_c0_g1_i1:99-470(-)